MAVEKWLVDNLYHGRMQSLPRIHINCMDTRRICVDGVVQNIVTGAGDGKYLVIRSKLEMPHILLWVFPYVLVRQPKVISKKTDVHTRERVDERSEFFVDGRFEIW